MGELRSIREKRTDKKKETMFMGHRSSSKENLGREGSDKKQKNASEHVRRGESRTKTNYFWKASCGAEIKRKKIEPRKEAFAIENFSSSLFVANFPYDIDRTHAVFSVSIQLVSVSISQSILINKF